MFTFFNKTVLMEPLKILIVEDEPKVAEFIKKGLEEQGFLSEVAYDGLIGKTMALTNIYQLIILDLNLPQINGFQLCQIIREINAKVPILMLTAIGGIDAKTEGFNAGADDYLLKPFEVRELILRIKALLRRSSDNQSMLQVLRIADLEVHKDEMKVVRAGKTIDLSAKEYKLLEYMIMNRDKVLSRIELTDHVWGLNFNTGTNIVDVFINFLRKKMDNDFEPKLIHTRFGLGYIFTDKPE
jgi:two-component system, OmpR family, copper resistance phosphate regulon response regulator CusR